MASDNLSHWLISTQVRVFLLCVTGKKKQLRKANVGVAVCVEINQ